MNRITPDISQLIFLRLPPELFSRVARVNIAFRSASRRYVTQNNMHWKAHITRTIVTIKQHGVFLDAVTPIFRTKRVCLAAVKRDGWALQYVPEHLRTEKVCLVAVKIDGWALPFVPEHILTEKVCLAAVKRDRWALQFVPDYLMTERVLDTIAIARKRRDYVPHSFY